MADATRKVTVLADCSSMHSVHCVVGVYAAHQAVMALGIDAEYVAPYLGRMVDAYGRDKVRPSMSDMRPQLLWVVSKCSPSAIFSHLCSHRHSRDHGYGLLLQWPTNRASHLVAVLLHSSSCSGGQYALGSLQHA